MVFYVLFLFLFFLLWVVYLLVQNILFPLLNASNIHIQYPHIHIPHAVYIKNKYTMLEYRTFVHLKFVFMHTNDGDIFPTFSLFILLALSLLLFLSFFILILVLFLFPFLCCCCFHFFLCVCCYKHIRTLAYTRFLLLHSGNVKNINIYAEKKQRFERQCSVVDSFNIFIPFMTGIPI